jgi:hypothetical protein
MTLRALGDARLREIVEDYMEAMRIGDVSRVVSMLAAEDAAWSMPPLASWYGGLAEIEVFLRRGPLSGDWRWRHHPSTANGQLAVGTYTWIEGEQTHTPFSLDVIHLGRRERSRRSPPSWSERPTRRMAILGGRSTQQIPVGSSQFSSASACRTIWIDKFQRATMSSRPPRSLYLHDYRYR